MNRPGSSRETRRGPRAGGHSTSVPLHFCRVKILYLSGAFHPFKGGVARYATGLALAMARAGHEVTVLTEEGNFAPITHRRQRLRHFRGHRNAGRIAGRGLRVLDMLRASRRELRDPAYDAVLVGT